MDEGYVYPIGISGQVFIFFPEVILHFIAHQQKWPWQREAGGQLFGKFKGNEIRIVIATGPRKNDKRGRNFYHPNAKAEKEEIAKYHREGLHYLGDWHTHPSWLPFPSPQDIQSMNDSFQKSNPSHLNGFVMVVVGIKNFPEGLYVGVCGKNQCVRLAHQSTINICKPS